MACPYCKSRRIAECETVKVFDINGEYIAIDRVLCGKCGDLYSRTIRQNLRTGERKVICGRCSDRVARPVGTVRKRGILSFFRRHRR